MYYCGNGEDANYYDLGDALKAAVRSLKQYNMDSCRVYKIVGHDPVTLADESVPVCRVSKLED